MSEPVIRLATLDDVDQFLLMAHEYLTELRTQGSDVIPTQRTLEHWARLFRVYVDGDPSAGVVVLAADPIPIAFSIAGAIGPQHTDTDFGRIAIGHGTYVRPSHRGHKLSRPLRDRVRAELAERGFDTLMGGVHINNAAGAKSLDGSNIQWHQIIGYAPLH